MSDKIWNILETAGYALIFLGAAIASILISIAIAHGVGRLVRTNYQCISGELYHQVEGDIYRPTGQKCIVGKENLPEQEEK